MSPQQQAPLLLLALPDPCLVAVLQCCADDGDPRSLLSAARAHSRLHQAAVLALSSIRAAVQQQQQAERLVQYLDRHGQHVSSLHIDGGPHSPGMYTAGTFPHGQLHLSKLQGLTSLSLCQLRVRLHGLMAPPSAGDQGVDPAAARLPLRRLALDGCLLTDEPEDLAAALAALTVQLPGLEQLSIRNAHCSSAYRLVPTGGQLCLPQRLSHLELEGFLFYGMYKLQFLQPLTRLQDLRLTLRDPGLVNTDWFSGLQCLTRFEAPGSVLEPGALAGKAQLQHLNLRSCRVIGGPAGVAQLLSHLQDLQQLTYLGLRAGLAVQAAGPVSAYSALTASSKLLHLDLSFCTLPEGAWQQLLPAGRQLPHLTALSIMAITHPAQQQPQGDDADSESSEDAPVAAAAPEGTRLASCCPGLQSLQVNCLWVDAQLLTPLVGLSSLQELSLSLPPGTEEEALAAVCQMTRLRQLACWHDGEDGMLLQLTQLRQLTSLTYRARRQGDVFSLCLTQAPGGESVWRQLLQACLQHPSDPALVQQAAAALTAAE